MKIFDDEAGISLYQTTERNMGTYILKYTSMPPSYSRAWRQTIFHTSSLKRQQYMENLK